jgi:hypothetical protein
MADIITFRPRKPIRKKVNMHTNNDLMELINRFFWPAKVGFGSAEYNLTSAGMIRMTERHVAGICRSGESWFDSRWTLTDRGRRASVLEIMRVILRVPPLWLAREDARAMIEYIHDDIASLAESDQEAIVWSYQRLAALDRRLERISRKAADRVFPCPL